MAVSTIIERIGAALSAGELKAMPDHAASLPVRTVGDLLRPWSEVYPWGDRETYGESVMRSGLTGRMHFEPQPRKSRRPLPAPRSLVASHKLLSHGLFDSVRAVWDWYTANNKADKTLLAAPCTGAGVARFVEKLSMAASDYYPLNLFLEDIGEHSPLMHTYDLRLLIPHYTYEQDEAGVVEAFLSGVGGMHSLLQDFYDEADGMKLELPPKDRDLIERVGFEDLVRTYYDYDGKKSCDLKRLDKCDETFFADVVARFPDHWERDFPLISGNGGMDNELSITTKEDIDFALAYAEAFTGMIMAIPFDPWQLRENEDGQADTFIHEVCEVWRKVKRKRTVAWTTPKGETLAKRMQRGEL
jgi:hypothetical protein